MKRSAFKFELIAIDPIQNNSAAQRPPNKSPRRRHTLQQPSRSAAVHPAIVAADDSLYARSQHAYRWNY